MSISSGHLSRLHAVRAPGTRKKGGGSRLAGEKEGGAARISGDGGGHGIAAPPSCCASA